MKTDYPQIDLYIYNPLTKEFAYYASTTWHKTLSGAKKMLCEKRFLKPEHVKAEFDK